MIAGSRLRLIFYPDFETTPLTTDSFAIRAFHVDSDGRIYSLYSSKLFFTTSAWPLDAPSDFVAAFVAENQIKLMWTDNSTSETGFSIERRKDVVGEDWAPLHTTGPNVTEYHDNSVAVETAYEYRIRATCTAAPGFSRWAGPVIGSTKQPERHLFDRP